MVREKGREGGRGREQGMETLSSFSLPYPSEKGRGKGEGRMSSRYEVLCEGGEILPPAQLLLFLRFSFQIGEAKGGEGGDKTDGGKKEEEGFLSPLPFF